MKMDIAKQLVALKKELTQERAKISARIQAIDAALGFSNATVATPEPDGEAKQDKKPKVRRKRRKMSAEGLAALKAAQKARWDKFHAEQQAKKAAI